VACDVPQLAYLPSMTPRRLHRSRDIRAVFAARIAAHGRLMTVYGARGPVNGLGTRAVISGTPSAGQERRGSQGGLLTSSSKLEDDSARVAVIAGRDAGSSVRRNRAKRRVRAALAARSLPPGMDLVVRARSATVEADFDDLQLELGDLIDRVLTKVCRPTRTGGDGREVP
jgi:ribonuclease P protein component